MKSCDICRKHRGEGPLRGELVVFSDGFWLYHAPPDNSGLAPLGYFFLESDRHAPYFADLTDQEASALGRLRSRVAAALREALDPEFVFAAVIGQGMAHFHEHVFARHRGIGADVPWYASDEAAPRADEARVRQLVEHVQDLLARS